MGILRDIVYGRGFDANWGGPLQGLLPPHEIDMDTVRELVDITSRALISRGNHPPGSTHVSFAVASPLPFGQSHTIASAALDGLSAADRNRLTATVGGPGSVVSLHFGVAPERRIIDLGSAVPGLSFQEAATLRDEVLAKVRAEGRPIFRSQRLLALGQFIVPLFLVALWVWLCADVTLPFPALAIGWTGCIAALWFAADRTVRTLRTQKLTTPIGARVREETREKTYARRMDERRDRKVALISGGVTLLVGLASGFALAVLTNAFGLAT